jgi:uncharacterized protein (TIGR02284 family)
MQGFSCLAGQQAFRSQRLRDMSDNHELVKILKDLASTCRDAEEGFNKAAKGAHSDELRSAFDRYSKERAEFAAVWDRFAQQHGGTAGETGHGGGVLRRGWSDLEQQIRPKHDNELAIQAADGDEGGLKHFSHALESGILPDDVRREAQKQMGSIRNTCSALRLQNAVSR